MKPEKKNTAVGKRDQPHGYGLKKGKIHKNPIIMNK